MTKKIKQVDLTTKQIGPNGKPNTAIYLPALSSFYSTTTAKYKDPTYWDATRMPVDFDKGIEGLDWLNKEDSYFYYKWSLYSAGHANIDVAKPDFKEAMVRERNRTDSFILGDSGGFQIGKLVWEGDWKDPACPKAQKKREQVLAWLEAYMDYGMILDIPVWACKNPDAAAKIGIASYQDAVDATRINNDYFMANRTGGCKFLNVLQGNTYEEADDWYAQMKDYCDPSVHPDKYFEGWSMGGQHVADPELALRRLVNIVHDGLLQQGKHDWIHFLGMGKVPWGCFLTDVQNSLRKYWNPDVTISMDSASPFLMVANGGIYTHLVAEDMGKWTTVMDGSVDDKKYSTDTRPFSEILKESRGYKNFDESPISLRLQGKDVCVYKPGDLNRIGKEGRTSWDMLSYVVQMGHNVFAHIDSIQRAIDKYQTGGIFPAPLIDREYYMPDGVIGRDLVDKIFAAKTKEEGLAIIEYHSRYLGKLVGGRGNKGNKRMNAGTQFDSLFEVVDTQQELKSFEETSELSEYEGETDKNLESLELGLASD